MSYSVCINCERMVPMYEKYCMDCLMKYPHLQQMPTFWQNSSVSWEHAKAIAKEEIAGRDRTEGE